MYFLKIGSFAESIKHSNRILPLEQDYPWLYPVGLWSSFFLFVENYDKWLIKPKHVEWIKVISLQKLLRKGEEERSIAGQHGNKESFLLETAYEIYKICSLYVNRI